MSNFPLAYKLSWLPRLLRPSTKGGKDAFLPPQAMLHDVQPQQTRRVVFLGDISAVANRRAPNVHARLRKLIAEADLVVGNCEAPVVERVRKPLGTTLGSRHAMTPAFLSETLDAIGADPAKLVLTLANNHMLDQGPEGFDETRAALAGRGIATIGTEDSPALVVNVGGVHIAFAAFTQWRNASASDFAGRITMLDDFRNRNLTALETVDADLKCVVAHWDREFRHFPQVNTRGHARTIAGHGIGLIVGHHAHALQPAELVGEALVAYGLGDFLSTALPRQPWPTRLGVVLCVDISADAETKGKVTYEFAPFFRTRDRDRERLVPLAELDGLFAARARRRFKTIFPVADS